VTGAVADPVLARSERIVAADDDHIVLKYDAPGAPPPSLRTAIAICFFVAGAAATVPAVVFYPRVGAFAAAAIFVVSFITGLEMLAVDRTLVITRAGIFNERRMRYTRLKRKSLITRWDESQRLEVRRRAGIDPDFDTPYEIYEVVVVTWRARVLWGSTSREVADAVAAAAERLRRAAVAQPANL
jgi:hypothetical protein